MAPVVEVDPLYVAARQILLDVLDALGTHRQAMVLPAGAGVAMAVRSAGPLVSEADVRASCEALASDLLAAIKR